MEIGWKQCGDCKLGGKQENSQVQTGVNTGGQRQSNQVQTKGLNRELSDLVGVLTGTKESR